MRIREEYRLLKTEGFPKRPMSGIRTPQGARRGYRSRGILSGVGVRHY